MCLLRARVHVHVHVHAEGFDRAGGGGGLEAPHHKSQQNEMAALREEIEAVATEALNEAMESNEHARATLLPHRRRILDKVTEKVSRACKCATATCSLRSPWSPVRCPAHVCCR